MATMVGDEWAKAGQELGKAGQEIGKATGKAVDTAQAAGGFFGKYLAAPLEEASGILTDRLRYTRWERQVRLAGRSKEFLRAQGISEPTRALPLNVGVPLIEAASLEEDDALQDVWAKLLANGADAASGIRLTRAFVSILQDMGALEAKLLEMIAYAPPEFQRPDDRYVSTVGLPDKYKMYRADEIETEFPPIEVEVALWNLSRLGCIELYSFIGHSTALAKATPLGLELIKAATRPTLRRETP